MNILTIDQLRKREYPGSEITIEETLSEEEKFTSYIASYYSDGLKIYGYLTVPKGKKPKGGWPVIIFNHGYVPLDEYATDRQYKRYVAYLANAGYIVFKPDYRGHGKSEGTPESLFESGYTVDVLNAVASIKKFSHADPHKIGVWGHSLGGDITMKVIEVNQDVKAAVIWSAPITPYDKLAQRWANQPIRRDVSASEQKRREESRAKTVAVLGDPVQNAKNYQAISPASNIDTITIPIQFHHGLADDRIPADDSVRIVESLKKAGKEAELCVYKNGDHNLSGEELGEAMQKSIAFFDHYLLS